MKKIRTVCVFVIGILGAVNVDAQIYLGKVDLKSYVGTWKYETPEETLIFKLKDTIVSYFDEEEYEIVLGTYKYIKNGVVVVDNMNMFPCVEDLEMPMIIRPGRTDVVGNMLQLPMTFKDSKTGKSSSDCIIEYVSPGSSEKKIQLILKDETDLILWENFGQGIDPEYDEHMRKKKLPGWTIPNNVILVKQAEPLF